MLWLCRAVFPDFACNGIAVSIKPVAAAWQTHPEVARLAQHWAPSASQREGSEREQANTSRGAEHKAGPNKHDIKVASMKGWLNKHEIEETYG